MLVHVASEITQLLEAILADLREQLTEGINSEKAAAQNALRTHREFQLAMTDNTASVSSFEKAATSNLWVIKLDFNLL